MCGARAQCAIRDRRAQTRFSCAWNLARRLSDEATDPEGGTTGIHRAIIGWWRLENMVLEPLFKPTD
ncbi:hypothetical protein SM11_pC1402 (plasmid) [Sinorhizobium meliloti SM11]|uniref:Uncharacterized protein n=1 Tax=Sinorhizobium meliloti (strain SM11) TaxID=707241 RepID=F7XBF7_SINMM|nr:hypothetical protein SM11_pC1402 [Sinorhizobium meliloti SM11]